MAGSVAAPGMRSVLVVVRPVRRVAMLAVDEVVVVVVGHELVAASRDVDVHVRRVGQVPA